MIISEIALRTNQIAGSVTVPALLEKNKITYADDIVIFTSSSHIDVIQSNLFQNLDNLSN